MALLLYDDRCCVCTTIASIVRRLSGSGIKTVGHYSEEGRNLKHRLFRADDNPEQMFWLVTGRTLYGGRNGIVPLLIEILRSRIWFTLHRPSRTQEMISFAFAESPRKCFGIGAYLERFTYTLGRGSVIRARRIRRF